MISSIVILAMVAAGLAVAWRFGWLNGLKTQVLIVLNAVFIAATQFGPDLLVMIVGVDPGLISTALDLDPSGRAMVQLGFLLLTAFAKSMSVKPGALGRMRQNRGR